MQNKILFGALFALLLINHQVGADGKISNIENTADEITMSFTTTANDTYQIQCSTNLSTNIWTDVGNSFIATDTVTEKTVIISTDQCYFRVIKEDVSLVPPPPPPPPPISPETPDDPTPPSDTAPETPDAPTPPSDTTPETPDAPTPPSDTAPETPDTPTPPSDTAPEVPPSEINTDTPPPPPPPPPAAPSA